MLHRRGLLGCDPDLALDLYTRQSCLRLSCADLAVMGATLADGGVNPLSGARVVSPIVCHHTLAAMLTAGLYETSGDWNSVRGQLAARYLAGRLGLDLLQSAPAQH